MKYSSAEFFFFVSFLLSIFYALRGPFRIWLLLLSSLAWWMTWKTEWMFLYFAILNLNFLALWGIEKLKARNPGFWLLLSVNIVIYILLKLEGVLPSNFEKPLGISFFMFMVIGLVVDQWRNPKDEKMPWPVFMLMPIFFPMAMAGPIERGRHFLSELNKQRNVLNDLCDGVLLASLGFSLNVFLLKHLQITFDLTKNASPSLVSYAFMGFMGTFVIYIELSSFALMGRGVGKCFGLDLPISFRPIYFSKDPNDFWSRWNITLGTWIRDYITFPMMLKFGRKIHPSIIILLSFIVVGLWHSISWQWLIFGLFNGLIIVLHNLTYKKFKSRILGRLFGLLIIFGNGLILADPRFDVQFDLVKFDNWEIIDRIFTPLSIFILELLLVKEIIEEFKNDHDWYLKLPLMVKAIASVVLLGAFLWALEGDILFQEKSFDVPIYFKI